MVLCYARLLISSMLLLILVGVVLFLIKPVDFYLVSLALCTAGFIVSLYAFFKLKTFEYEDSIFYITIKQAYFWKNKPEASIEFPNDVLAGFNIRKRLFTTSLVLVIKSKEQKKRKLYCKINALTNSQIFELKESLKNVKEYGED